MYQKQTVIIVAITMLFAGILLGTGIGIYASIKTSEEIAQSAQLIHGERTSYWSSRSYNAYLNEPPVVGIWALEGMVEEFNKLLGDASDNQLFYDRQTLYKDLFIAHARLVKLHNKTGNNKAMFHKEQAMHYAQLGYPSEKLNNIDNIINFVEKIDTAQKEQNVEKKSTGH